MNGNRLGEILLEADVLTKRQLNKALAMQAAGDSRKLGEILIELKYITLEDLTEIMKELSFQKIGLYKDGWADWILQNFNKKQ